MADMSPDLPKKLPEGEAVVWCGRPSLGSLARHAFHLPGLAIYFAFLVGWVVLHALWLGYPPRDIGISGLKVLGLSVTALGLVGGYAWMVARNTEYTITTGRVILRIGLWLPIWVNIPFAEISSSGLRLFKDGSGNLELEVNKARRISYLLVWPHAKAFRLRYPVPVMLSVPDAQSVAGLFGQTVAAACTGHVQLGRAAAPDHGDAVITGGAGISAGAAA
jgi:hypothetical protein